MLGGALAIAMMASDGVGELPIDVVVHFVALQESARDAVEAQVLPELSGILEHTRLRLRAPDVPERVGLDRCAEEGSLACWVRAGAARFADMILTVSVRRASGGRWGVSLLLLPTGDAQRQLVAEGSQTDALEGALFAQAIAVEGELEQRDRAAWRRLVGQVLDALAERDPSTRVGTLVVESEAPDALLSLDGAAVGALSGGRLELRRVASGEHALQLVDPSGAWVHEPVRVRVHTSSVTRVALTVAEPPRSDVPVIGGLAMTVAGAAILVYALAAPSDRDLCVSDCPSRFVGFGEGSGAGSALLIAPLGYSLALAGVGWAGTSRWIPPVELAPWISLAAGLALGGVSYAISAAAGGG